MTVHRDLRSPAALQYRHAGTLAGSGVFRESLRGIALAADGRVVAVGDAGVVVLERDGSVSARWETEHKPLGVHVDALGRVHVGELAQVEIFDLAGARIEVLKDVGRLGRVTALASLADLGGGWLVADASHRCLRRYSAAGAHVRDLGHDGRMKGFLIPNGHLDFALDGDGVVHATNPGKHRVERYSLDGELLGHIGRFDGRDPEGFAGCCNPTNVALDAQGRVYVTEKAEPRAKVHDASGRLLAVVASDVFDRGCKNMDLAVDADGRVHVVDTVRLEVLVFEPVEDAGDGGRR